MSGTVSPASDIKGFGIFWGSSESRAPHGLLQVLQGRQTAVDAALIIPAIQRSSGAVT